MSKYFIKSTGESVELGDFIQVKFSNSKGVFLNTGVLDEESIPILLKLDLICEKKDGGTHLDIMYYISHLANRIHWTVENVIKYLDNLSVINETARFQILLREVAIVLDKKYKDHIENSEELWTISLLNGEIVRIYNRNKIKNYRNFSAFRTLDDAKAAKHILKPLMVDLFKKHE